MVPIAWYHGWVISHQSQQRECNLCREEAQEQRHKASIELFLLDVLWLIKRRHLRLQTRVRLVRTWRWRWITGASRLGCDFGSRLWCRLEMSSQLIAVQCNSINKSVLSYLCMLTMWHCLHLPTPAVINISCLPGPQQQTCSNGFTAVGPCWDRQVDGCRTISETMLCMRAVPTVHEQYQPLKVKFKKTVPKLSFIKMFLLQHHPFSGRFPTEPWLDVCHQCPSAICSVKELLRILIGQPDVSAVTKPTVSMHWRKLKVLTLTRDSHILALTFLNLPPDSEGKVVPIFQLSHASPLWCLLRNYKHKIKYKLVNLIWSFITLHLQQLLQELNIMYICLKPRTKTG